MEANADSKTSQPLGVASTEGLGPSVPDEVMLYVHAYGDSRADDDGLSALRIGETVLSLRRWAARLQAAERERCAKKPLTAQQLDKLIEAHVGGAELADGEYSAMVLFAAAVERAHGIGA